MKKKWLSMMLVLLVAVATACSGTGNSGTGTQGDGNKPSPTAGSTVEPSKQPDPVELRIMWWGDQKRADKTNEALRKFEEKNPHIKIVGEFAPSSGYFDKLNTMLASGTAPDIFFLGGNMIDYANKGVLLELDSYVGNELDLSDMDQTMIDYGKVNDKLLHVSAGANARGIVVNTTLFEKAGMDIPKDGWDWDDYARISKEIYEKLNKEVYGTYDLTKDGMDIFLKQRGKQLYNAAANELAFDQHDALEWFGYWDQLRKDGGLVTAELQVSNPPDDTANSLIVTGKVAMNLIPSNQLPAHQNLTEDVLTLVQLPRGPKGTGVVFESSQGMSGYNKTKHPKEVAQLMSYWINDPDAAAILGNDRGVPVTSTMREVLKQAATPVEQIIYDYTSRVSEAVKTEPFSISYNLPGQAEFTKLQDTTIQEIGFGRKNVQKASEDFFNGAVKIFESNK